MVKPIEGGSGNQQKDGFRTVGKLHRAVGQGHLAIGRQHPEPALVEHTGKAGLIFVTLAVSGVAHPGLAFQDQIGPILANRVAQGLVEC
ncbi:MAG: hypothetical protein BWY72_01540 [Bacteroidetes bacterium ADurb.Bin416]|nr:MAG: hypothetical protein BWY72_01540 [Bacteroidetes bacterium ADurb.Bin416]